MIWGRRPLRDLLCAVAGLLDSDAPLKLASRFRIGGPDSEVAILSLIGRRKLAALELDKAHHVNVHYTILLTLDALVSPATSALSCPA